MKNHYIIFAVLLAVAQFPPKTPIFSAAHSITAGLLKNSGRQNAEAVNAAGVMLIGRPQKATPLNTLTEAEKAEGWQLLFDGETTKGWHIYNHRSDGSSWKTFDGMLHLDPTGGGRGDLVSDETYENFHLSLEWKIAERGNSGVLFCVQEDSTFAESWFTGPEMQILDNAGNPDALVASHRAGDLYDLISAAKETVNRSGKWNTADIRMENEMLDLFLNGEKMVSVKMGSGDWKWLVSESKFRHIPDFGKVIRGHIVLQDQGDPVWFRNIKIRTW